MRFNRELWLALIIGTVCIPSHADSADSANSADQTHDDSPWKASIGPLLVISPKYLGAATTKEFLVPDLTISYKDRIFSDGLDFLGVNFISDPDYHVGTALSYDFQSRKSSDDVSLVGLGNVRSGVSWKVFGDYSWSFLSGAVASYKDISGHREGEDFTADLTVNWPFAKGWLLSVGPGLTWADAEYAQSHFGISAAASTHSHFSAFTAPAGMEDQHATIYCQYDISKHWNVNLTLVESRLMGADAATPITKKASSQTTYAAAIYSF